MVRKFAAFCQRAEVVTSVGSSSCSPWNRTRRCTIQLVTSFTVRELRDAAMHCRLLDTAGSNPLQLPSRAGRMFQGVALWYTFDR